MSPRKGGHRAGVDVCIIPADIAVAIQKERRWPADAADDPYRFVREELNGWPEIVPCGDDKGLWTDVMMFVDEDGKLRSDRRFNLRASILYGFFQHGSFIVGDAVLMGRARNFEVRNLRKTRVTSLEPYFARVMERELDHYIQGVIASGFRLQTADHFRSGR
jgi:hypothetical protein